MKGRGPADRLEATLGARRPRGRGWNKKIRRSESRKMGLSNKGLIIDRGHCMDVLVEGRILVELKAIERLLARARGTFKKRWNDDQP